MSSGQAAYDAVTDTAILVWMVANHVQLVDYHYQSRKAHASVLVPQEDQFQDYISGQCVISIQVQNPC